MTEHKTLPPEAIPALYEEHGSLKAIARYLECSFGFVQRRYAKAVELGLMAPLRSGRKSREEAKTNTPPVIEGQVKAIHTKRFTLPVKGQVYRYLFTCAQNNTEVHRGLWDNLNALSKHYNAAIFVACTTYIKSGLGASGDKNKMTNRAESLGSSREMTWDPLIPEACFLDKRVEVAPGLVWCGEMNILPTAVSPLTGLEVYTGRRSGIFPHPKLAMASIPSMRGEPTKFNYTTGTLTLRNYIQRKAGLKAEFHHSYGALLVEVDSDGNWFCRQINADSEGTIYDLTTMVSEGVVTTGVPVEAITWGDIHVHELDMDVAEMAWGHNGMLGTLQPTYQFLHDVLDFHSRSHHEIKDPHLNYLRYVNGAESVEGEVAQVREFLNRTTRATCQTVVVDSNHHQHLGRWLKEQNGLRDPVNARFWLKLQERVYNLLHAGKRRINHLEVAVNLAGGVDNSIRFLAEDEGFVVCDDAHGGIECGLHGHAGPSGSRGNPKTLAKMGRRANTGHTHQAGIYDGLYVSGTSGELEPEWTRGPGAWSHSHTVTYENGKRAIITMFNGKWRA